MLLLTWEETGFKDTKNDTQRNHLVPLQYEGKAHVADTPENRDRGEENSWADFAQDDGCRWLQDNVGQEEDEGDDGISIADQIEIWRSG